MVSRGPERLSCEWSLTLMCTDVHKGKWSCSVLLGHCQLPYCGRNQMWVPLVLGGPGPSSCSHTRSGPGVSSECLPGPGGRAPHRTSYHPATLLPRQRPPSLAYTSGTRATRGCPKGWGIRDLIASSTPPPLALLAGGGQVVPWAV